MATPTFAQAQEILKLVVHTHIGREGLQRLLESGLFSELLKADLDLVDRKAFTASLVGLKNVAHFNLPTYEIEFNPDLSYDDMVKQGKFNWVNDDIKGFFAQQCKVQEEATSHYRRMAKGSLKVYLVPFGRDMMTAEVLAELDKMGLRPASLRELCALAAVHTEFQRQFSIVALGLPWQRSDGFDGVWIFYGDNFKRNLNFDWSFPACRWESRYRFLAVGK